MMTIMTPMEIEKNSALALDPCHPVFLTTSQGDVREWHNCAHLASEASVCGSPKLASCLHLQQTPLANVEL
jgi:hypothetical protein